MTKMKILFQNSPLGSEHTIISTQTLSCYTKTYLELERMAMIVVYTSTIEAMSAVPNETRTR
jgi:hypothetical protein